MATRVVMEALSPTMEEGKVVSWRKREGDAVSTGDTLAEVETDKAVMEIVARADGTLLAVLAEEGATVPVGEPLAVIGASGEDISQLVAGAAPASQPAAAPSAPSGPPQASPVQPPAPPRPTPVAPEKAATAPALGLVEGGATDHVRASPLARRLARERGLDLRRVPGSGPGGRVIKRDVEAAAPPALAPAPAPAAAAAAAAYDDLPLSPMRKTIAKRLAQSLGPIPTFYLTTEVDMERVWEARGSLNAQSDVKISFNDVIVKATALALTRHPSCNAWWQDDHVRRWNEVHLGMAVAVDDGLITPVIRHADRKPLTVIAAEARDLAERARQRKLAPAEYTGATFSVSNLGMFVIDEFTAVINPPEAGILAVGRIMPKPVADEAGAVAVRRRMRLTMSCDHRVIDGATGAAFLGTLVRMLENPLAMLL